MKGMFINCDGPDYAGAIVKRLKTIETRNRNMLRELVGEWVAVVKTKRGHKPMVIGTVFVVSAQPIEKYEAFEFYREWTLIPRGSKFDFNGTRKWFYFLACGEPCEPYELPANAVRHGRSWCEF